MKKSQQGKSKINPMKGVVKPDELTKRLRAMDYSYVRGALQYLQRHPPNPHIVPLLRLALEKFKNEIRH